MKDIDFKIRFRQNQEEWLRLLLGGHDVKLFAVPPVHRGEVHVSVPGRWSSYDATCLLYVPASSLYLYCTGMYQKCVMTSGEMRLSLVNDSVLFPRRLPER